MHALPGDLSLTAFLLAIAVTLAAGFVKGAVGFAMPMIMIGAFGAFMPGHEALAALILPTLLTNIAQALRQGWRAAWGSVIAYRRMIAMIVVFIVISAQFVTVIPQGLMYALLGVPIVAFALYQLSGRPMSLRLEHRIRAEYLLGAIGGLYGGISGVWGPPVLVYLVSTHAEKREQLRVQGVVFLIGAVILFFAHLRSGVLNATTLPLSAALIVPAWIGMVLGFRLQDRLDAARFRRWTLIVLAITGLNLVRKAAGL